MISSSRVLARSFFARPTKLVARELLGMVLWHVTPQGVTAGRIVETEAYLGRFDPASHSFGGPTARTQVMFGPVGYSYVYFTYGMHYCVNVIARAPGEPSGGVLIRALEPLEGIELMRKRRQRANPRPLKEKNLCSGPAKLTQALGIDITMNGLDLRASDLRVLLGTPVKRIQASPRVGISKAKNELLRFFEAGNECVSKAKV